MNLSLSLPFFENAIGGVPVRVVITEETTGVSGDAKREIGVAEVATVEAAIDILKKNNCELPVDTDKLPEVWSSKSVVDGGNVLTIQMSFDGADEAFLQGVATGMGYVDKEMVDEKTSSLVDDALPINEVAPEEPAPIVNVQSNEVAPEETVSSPTNEAPVRVPPEEDIVDALEF